MVDINHTLSLGADTVPGRRDEVVHRLLLCAVAATVEGLLAFNLVFDIALLYHLLILHQAIHDFATLFYSGFALLAALVYGLFAAAACSRLLDRTLNAQSGVQHAFFAWTATIALILLTAFLFGKVGDFSRVSLTSAYIVGIPLSFAVRSALLSFLDGRIRRGELHFETVAIIGNRIDVVNFLLGGELWRQGHKVTHTLYFEDVRNESGALEADRISDFAGHVVKHGTDHIVFVGSLADLDELDGIVANLKRYALNLLYAPAALGHELKFLDIVAIGPNNVLRFVRTPMTDASVLLKRSMDIALAAFGLIVLAPLFAVVALAIVLETRGPVIYRQARRGFNGDIFMIWKFRSMSVTESGYQMAQAQKNDSRITRIGRFIRATSIDELPQLVNVLLGHMSLVGPRPHAVSHDEELSRQLASYAHRQRILPGITGWAQTHGYRGETSSPDQIRGRVEHDIYYIDHWSILLDIWTLILTVFSPTTRRNAR